MALVALAIAITGGTLILSALEGLLGLGSDKVAEALFKLTALFAFPLFWLALARLDPIPDDNLLLQALSMATDALLIPLVLAFGAVIHAYALRIAVAGELPNGQIGWIVPVYVSVGYGVYCVASGPAPRLPRVRAFFHRAWIPSTLAPLLLLGLALAVRLRAYGVTEERYFLLLVAIGGAGLAASALVRRPFDIRLLPLTVGVLTLAAAIGPFNVLSVSVRSQTERARAILASVPAERWAAERDGGLTETQKGDLLSAVEYLHSHTGTDLKPLAAVWPPGLQMASHALKEQFESVRRPFSNTFLFYGSDVIQLGSLTWIADVYIRSYPVVDLDVRSRSRSYTLRSHGQILAVEGEGTTTRFDLSPLFQMNPAASRNERPILSSIEGRKGHLIVDKFDRHVESTGTRLDNMLISIVLY